MIIHPRLFFEKMKSDSDTNTPQDQISAIPTVDYLIKSYARNSTSDDQKAARAFLDFESHEKLQRLRNELIHIKNSQVNHALLDQIVGGSRKSRYQSYENWAGIVLQLLLKK